MTELRGIARVCGDCWNELRPDEYEPEGGTDESPCSRCGLDYTITHRVSWDEIDANPPEFVFDRVTGKWEHNDDR